MTNLIIDTNTSYQPYDVGYYKKMLNFGVRSNFVKVTEGNSWVADHWIESLNNSQKAGLIPCVYHFQRATNNAQATNEGEFFAKQLDNAKVAKSIKIMIDAEINGNNTDNILTLIGQLKKHGYQNFTVYSGRYRWVTSDLDQNRLPRPWVAGYGVNDLGINNAQAWQYSNTFNGYKQDISKDLTKDQWFTTDSMPHNAPEQPSHVNTPSQVVTVPQGIDGVARDAIRGVYGNGSQRPINIYNHVQNAVNLKASGQWKSQENHNIALIADDVLFNGKYGNGSARRDNIYNAVQKRVNELLQ